MSQDELNKLLVNIGNRIRSLRKKENISQLELGNIVGRSANQIGRIERAEGNPTIETLYRIATHYKVDISYFIDRKKKFLLKSFATFLASLFFKIAFCKYFRLKGYIANY
ncbi:helix-turn-helix domain-containing protein [Gramella sp. GC03-9]|uniref:Helix-turn-helix domain-containing protein n=1 Tax=Christiangramia oceanisediminis TaxID=2920386 RepID=A0A9X2RA97_9FLAO|nr:helix-turn-helix transcriptional regulator [Gramella oceanisediminis]MCP9201322.1 helix-turn-helix domain-containing protein [Gramella oceanisediminis]